MPQKTFHYTKENLTVIWKPDLCIHSGICVRGLPEVFNSAKKPWIDLSQSELQAVIHQVQKCPSGALSYEWTEGPRENMSETATPISEERQITQIRISPNGPILIHSQCEITLSNGTKESKQGVIALCRCGQSKNKPYCDGSHKLTGFVG
jgi:uncharacterized Fe-S cluster protein YjdI